MYLNCEIKSPLLANEAYEYTLVEFFNDEVIFSNYDAIEA
eukprot:IDg5812t1